jgi:putative transposase
MQSEPSPSHQFSVLLNAYAKTINKAYHRTGSLFQHPFGRIPVTNRIHFNNLVCYIHQNPQHHGFVKDFREWPFSSYHVHLANQDTFVNRQTVLECFHGSTDYMDAHDKEPELKLIQPLVSDDFF